MPPKGKKRAYGLANIEAEGLELKDIFKTVWKVGKQIGQGGFGKLYQVTDMTKGTGSQYILKLEPAGNGPLFSELSFYKRHGRKDDVEKWKSTHRIKSLGMPYFVGYNKVPISGEDYRFMVMPQYGSDLQRIYESCSRRFSLKNTCILALQMLDVLDYLHTHQYVHADLKAANMLLGLKDPHQAYLVDYGLAYRFRDDKDKHTEYKEDLRKGGDGTLEFTSIDAHNGCRPSMRGDLEILGYCCLQWLCGTLPWEKETKKQSLHAVRVAKTCMKKKTKKYIQDALQPHAADIDLKFLIEYMEKVYSLDYDETPVYTSYQKIFTDMLNTNDIKNDKKLDFTKQNKIAGRKRSSTSMAASPQKKRVKTENGDNSPVKGKTPVKESVRRTPSKKQTPLSGRKKKSVLSSKSTPPATSRSKSTSKSTSGTDYSKIIPKEAYRRPGLKPSPSHKSSPQVRKLKKTTATQTSPGLKCLRGRRKKPSTD